MKISFYRHCERGVLSCSLRQRYHEKKLLMANSKRHASIWQLLISSKLFIEKIMSASIQLISSFWLANFIRVERFSHQLEIDMPEIRTNQLTIIINFILFVRFWWKVLVILLDGAMCKPISLITKTTQFTRMCFMFTKI